MRKPFFIVVVFSLMAIAGQVSAHAQVVDTIKADIPFGFKVGKAELPAGKYTLKRLESVANDVMEIQGDEMKTPMLFTTFSAQSSAAPNHTELIFDHVGDQYFLSKIFEEGNNIGVAVPLSREEKKLEREGAMVTQQPVVVVDHELAGRQN